MSGTAGYIHTPSEILGYLIYCRSGVRSVTAADLLEAYGYTNLIEFGGILFWPYGVER